RRSVLRDLKLNGRGLELISPDVRAFVPQPEGLGLVLYADPARTAEGLVARSRSDARAYPAFDRKVRSLASFVAHLNVAPPPDISSPALGDAVTGVKLARLLRGLGAARGVREAMRVLPMPVADFVE